MQTPSFAILLKQHRLAAALSQETLAERARLSTRAISDLERGIHRAPYPDTVRVLANALRLTGAARRQLVESATHSRLDRSAASRSAPPTSPTSLGIGGGRLPRPMTRLFGRGQEEALVLDVLRRPDVRLVVLTGLGGVGKTRLAIQVATVAERTVGEVAFVSLAATRDAELVPGTMAQALGLRTQHGQSAEETLRACLQDRDMLLVVDNVEQVLGAGPLLVELLAACPGLKLLVTSRAALRVAGEHEIAVLPLPVPPPAADSPSGAAPSLEVIGQAASVQLFVERAAARRPTFELTAEVAPFVVDICRRLDGIPLAIELAAARVGMLPVDEIAARMDDRFELLTAGTRGAPTRQQTLRATLDWSYELLSEPEQRLFRYLGVFVGGWTLVAAERVGSGQMAMGHGIFDLLAGLVDTSVVIAEPTHPGGTRYRLLETVRAYALERLSETEYELRDARSRHAVFFRRLAERAEPELLGVEQAAWLKRLELELGNIRAVLDWAHESGAWEGGLRLAGSLSAFWMFANHLREGRDALSSLLAVAPAGAPVRLKALWAASFLEFHLGDQPAERSIALRQEGLALARELGDPREIGRFLIGAGSEAVVRGDVDRARALLDEALALARKHDEPRRLQVALMWLGMLHWSIDDLAPARRLIEEALAASPRVPDARTTANALAALAEVVLLQGDPHRAAALGRESLVVRQSVTDTWSVGMTLVILARVDVATARFERAARLFGAAEGLRIGVGVTFNMPPRWHDDRARALAATHQALDDEAFEAAWADGWAMTREEAIAYAEAGECGGPAPDDPRRPPPPGPLTRREREVAAMMARGLTNREIADDLVISERTVDTHAEHIRDKLDVRSRAEVAAWVTRYDLAESRRA